ncbi:MATE family efflux transporter [Planococcus sp. ISL-109]|nr:MATE family efflux transporter [Planococcus sp. ISL-109]
MVEYLLQTVVGFVDTLFIARIGLQEVTAVGIATAVLAIYLALFMALGVGTSSLVARKLGADDLSGARKVAQESLGFGTVVAVILSILTWFGSEFLMSLFGAEDEVVRIGAIYLKIVGGGALFLAWMTLIGSILRAGGDTKSPMKVAWIINIVHIPLNYIFIFGIGDWGGWGVAGAAWTTLFVRVLGTWLLWRYLKKSSLAVSLLTLFSWDKHTKEMVYLAVPAAAERMIMRIGQVVYFGLIVAIGTKTFAAHTIAGNIEMFSYMPGYGLALAATTLVGQSWGAGNWREAYHYGLLTAAIGVVFMSFIGLVMFIWAPWFASWFTQDPEAIEMVSIALRIDAFAQPALAVGLILTGALQGLGDTKSPMYSTAIGMWAVRIVGIYFLGIYLEMGIAGIWLAIAADITLRAIYLFFRFKSHAMKKKTSEKGGSEKSLS